jgi:succinate-acetate transporter protein
MAEERNEAVGNPTPIGLMGLAIGCAALAPAELGLTDPGDPAIWVWMLLTAGALQIFAGVADLVNRNVLGATAFTLYGTLWLISAWLLAGGAALDPAVKGFIYIIYLMFTIFMTIGFATVSLTLTVVFCAFILIFTVEIGAAFLPAMHPVALAVAGILHAVAAVLAVWAAAGAVINPLLGRTVFAQGQAPLQTSGHEPRIDDFESLMHHQTLRRRIVATLYHYWEHHAWDWISTADVGSELGLALPDLAPDFWYLYQKGFVALDEERQRAEPGAPKQVRLTAAGIDYYRELQMNKVKF